MCVLLILLDKECSVLLTYISRLDGICICISIEKSIKKKACTRYI